MLFKISPLPKLLTFFLHSFAPLEDDSFISWFGNMVLVHFSKSWQALLASVCLPA